MGWIFYENLRLIGIILEWFWGGFLDGFGLYLVICKRCPKSQTTHRRRMLTGMVQCRSLETIKNPMCRKPRGGTYEVQAIGCSRVLLRAAL